MSESIKEEKPIEVGLGDVTIDGGGDDEEDKRGMSWWKKVTQQDAEELNKADGVETENDLHVTGLAAAKDALLKMIQEAKAAATFKSHLYDMPYIPLKKRGLTFEDFVGTFCLWSQKPEDVEPDTYNVTKAFTRFKGLLEWTMEREDDVLQYEITDYQLSKLSDMWGMTVRRDSQTQQIVYFFSMAKADVQIEEDEMYKFFDVQTPRETFNGTDFYVALIFNLFANVCLLDGASTKGVCMIQDLNKMGMLELMKMEPKGMRGKMGKLQNGAFPTRFVGYVALNPSFFLKGLFRFMRLFISKKMAKRLRNADSVADALVKMGYSSTTLPASAVRGSKSSGGVTGAGSDDIVFGEWNVFNDGRDGLNTPRTISLR